MTTRDRAAASVTVTKIHGRRDGRVTAMTIRGRPTAAPEAVDR